MIAPIALLRPAAYTYNTIFPTFPFNTMSYVFESVNTKPSDDVCHFMRRLIAHWINDKFINLVTTLYKRPGPVCEKRAMLRLLISMRLARGNCAADINWSYLMTAVLPVMDHHIILELADKFLEINYINEGVYLEICDLLKKLSGSARTIGISIQSKTTSIPEDYASVCAAVMTRMGL